MTKLYVALDVQGRRKEVNQKYYTKKKLERQKTFLGKAKTLASERDGKCVSTEYENAHTKLLWECSKGHRWLSLLDQIKIGQWCKICKGSSHDLQTIVEFVKQKGGKCLTTDYTVGDKVLLECSNSHQWSVSFQHLKDGRWCRICATKNRMDTIDDAHEYAKKRGGKCLSEKYTGFHQKIEWSCEHGHTWRAKLSNIKQGTWCRKCLMYSLEDLQKHAKEKGGECLADEFISIHHHVSWKCNKNHEWTATWGSVLHYNTWCPYCSKFRSEGACREIFESLFEIKFPKSRPKFLKGLELDGYNEHVQLAFEYQGKQHYEYIPFFHKSEEGFKTRQERDRRKYNLCIQNRVTLILVPYTFNYNNIMELETYIIDQCVNHGIKNEMETIINFIE